MLFVGADLIVTKTTIALFYVYGTEEVKGNRGMRENVFWLSSKAQNLKELKIVQSRIR